VNPSTEEGTFSQNNIIVNVTAADTNLDIIIINLYNESGLYNSTASVSSPHYLLFNNLEDGTYYVNATANDTLEHINTTETRVINLDTTGPEIAFVDQTLPNATITTNTSAIINISIIEEEIKEMVWNWNGTNTTFYDENLIIMYNFDNISEVGENNSYVVDMSNYGNNGTFKGENEPKINCTSKKYGCALTFDGIDDYITLENHARKLGVTNNATFEAWVNLASSGHNTIVSDYDALGSQDGFTFRIDEQNNVFMYGYLSGVLQFRVNTTETLDLGKWYHVAGMINGTHASAYINGVQSENISVQNGAIGNSQRNISVGIRGDGTHFMDGQIDEIRIWNRSFTPEEIKQHYYSNLNKYETGKWLFYSNQSNLSIGTYTYQAFAKDNLENINETETRYLTIESDEDIEAPTWSPLHSNQTVEYLTAFSYGVNAIDNVEIDTYYIDDTSNFKINSSTGLIENKTFLSVGEYPLTISVNDTSGNENSANITIIIQDTTAPTITIVSPTTQTYGTSSINFEISSNEALNHCHYSINDWATNVTIDEITSTSFSKTSTVDDGSYTARFWCNDTSGNIDSGETVSFSVDTTGPTVTLVNPTTQTGIQDSTTIIANATASDPNLDTIIIYLENSTGVQEIYSGTSSPLYTIFTDLLSDTYTLYVWANDTLGNSDTSGSRTITIDNENPVVSLQTPTDQFWSNTSTILFTCSATNAALANITLYHNINGVWGANETKNITGTSNSTLFTINNVPENNTGYTWNCLVYDSLGYNAFDQDNATFYVDTTYPEVTLSLNTTMLELGIESIKIDWNASDENILYKFINITKPNGSVEYYSENDSQDVTLEPVDIDQLGTYTVTAFIIDNATNYNVSIQTFTVQDTIYPNIQFVDPTPENGTHNLLFFWANVTAQDQNIDTIEIF